MTRSILTLLIVVLTSCQPVFASACYTIGGDAQRYCLAKERGDRSLCYAIQDGGMRAQCLAELSE